MMLQLLRHNRYLGRILQADTISDHASYHLHPHSFMACKAYVQDASVEESSPVVVSDVPVANNIDNESAATNHPATPQADSGAKASTDSVTEITEDERRGTELYSTAIGILESLHPKHYKSNPSNPHAHVSSYTDSSSVNSNQKPSSHANSGNSGGSDVETTQDPFLVLLKSFTSNLLQSVTGRGDFIETLVSGIMGLVHDDGGSSDSSAPSASSVVAGESEVAYKEGVGSVGDLSALADKSVDVVVPIIERSDSVAVKRGKALRMLEIAGYRFGNKDALLSLGDMYLVGLIHNNMASPTS
jgi:hypothetical protein